MSSLKQVWSHIKKYKSFLICTHHNPDADAASSALSMALVLKKMGKKTHIVNDDNLPEWLGFLPGAKSFKKRADIKKIPSFDCVIILDAGEIDRIGGVRKWITGQSIINIDHHVTNDNFGLLNVVWPKASSTCEVLFDLFKEAKVKMNKDLAVLLYAGIMTDTGSFRFENTNSTTHAIASELLKFGLSVSDLHSRLYVGIPVKDIRGFIGVIHNSELLLNNKVYCVMLPQSITQSFSKKFDLKEKIFSFLRSVEGIEVVVILHELNSKLTRVNLRSQNNFDVAKLASQFQGGGHRKAAGAKIDANLNESKKKILTAIRKAL